MTKLKNLFVRNRKLLSVFFSVAFSVLVVAVLVHGATTIGTYIATGGDVNATGTLLVDGLGTSTFRGNFEVEHSVGFGSFASSTQALNNNSVDLGAYDGAWKDLYASGTFYGEALTLGGNTNATGTLTVDGDVTLGDAITDTITVTGQLGSLFATSTLQVTDAVNLYSTLTFGNGTDIQGGISTSTWDGGTIGASTVVTSGDFTAIGSVTPGTGVFTTLTANGDATLGSDHEDTIIVNATTTLTGVQSDLVVEGVSTSSFAGTVLMQRAVGSYSTTTLQIGGATSTGAMTPGTGGCIALYSASSTAAGLDTLYLYVTPTGVAGDAGDGGLMLATSTSANACYGGAEGGGTAHSN